MNENVTLVILAAGMGSRFGGLKQIEPLGPNDEFIIDYSVFDAIRAGFNKIVFIIKKENYELFKETIGKRVEPYIKVEYVFQELSNLPKDYSVSDDRVKPLGTAHALFCASSCVKEPFAMINADDFYGRDAFVKAYNFLKSVDIFSNNYGMIGYVISSTLTDNGSVKRGICSIDKEHYLRKITESKVEKSDGKIVASPIDGSDKFVVNEDEIGSMNFLLFTPTIFKYIEDGFNVFFNNNKDDLLTSEYLIPDVVSDLIKNNRATMKVIRTTAKWYGVTYREDVPNIKMSIKKLVDDGEYNNNLWS